MIGIIKLSESEEKNSSMGVVPAITPSRFHTIISKWGNIARYGECASVYYYTKANLMWRLYQLSHTKGALKRYFGNKSVGYIDAEMSLFEAESAWTELFDSRISYDVIFVLGLDRYLHEKNRRIFTILEHIRSRNPQISFIFFFQTDFTNSGFSSLFSAKSVFFQNVIIEPFLSRNDCGQFMRYLEADWNIKIPPTYKHAFLEACGHQYWLIKEAVRRLRDDPKITIEKILIHPILMQKVTAIWEQFLEIEQQVILKILKNNLSLQATEVHSLRHLELAGWIYKTGETYRLSIPLLQQYVEQTILKKTLEAGARDSIILNGIPVTGMFSAQEQSVLLLFLQNESEIISRERVAQIIWKREWDTRYSDWAIDKLISRLRKKLKSLETSRNIQTIRNKGFQLMK